MKKTTTLIAIVLLLISRFTGLAQCTIDTSNHSNGFNPTNLPCITANVAYGQTQQIYLPPVGPGGITIDSAAFVSITGLPAGVTYTINPASGIIMGNGHGCIWFSGTSNPAGGSPLTINGTAYTSAGNIPISNFVTDTLPLCAGPPCTIDTSNHSNGFNPTNLPCINPFVAYSQVQQIYIPGVGPGGITIDSAVFLSITGLPAGITYAGNPANGIVMGNGRGCILFSGMANPTASSPLTINGTAYTSAGNIPISNFVQDTLPLCGPPCTVDTSNHSNGFNPTNLPCINPLVPYSQVQQIYIPGVGPGGITIDSASFTGITGLPAGITFEVYPSNGIIMGNGRGCVLFSGTTNITSGTFGLTVNGTLTTSGGIFPASNFITDTVSICGALGVQQINEGNLKLYPNPANDVLNVEWTVQTTAEMTVTNMNGEQVSHFEIVGGKLNTYDVHDLASGIYTISIVDKQTREIHTTRFAKF